jgi:hypothetical protein
MCLIVLTKNRVVLFQTMITNKKQCTARPGNKNHHPSTVQSQCGWEVVMLGSGGIYIGLEEGKAEGVDQSEMMNAGGDYHTNRESPSR